MDQEKIIKKIKRKAKKIKFKENAKIDAVEVDLEKFYNSKGEIFYHSESNTFYKEMKDETYISYKEKEKQNIEGLKKEFVDWSVKMRDYAVDIDKRLGIVEKSVDTIRKNVDLNCENNEMDEIKDVLKRLGESHREMFNNQQILLKKIIKLENSKKDDIIEDETLEEEQ